MCWKNVSVSSPLIAKVSMPLSTRARGDVVLGRQRVRGAERHLGAAGRSVCIRFAVSVVTCRHAPMRMPSSGRSFSKRSRISASTGISPPAHSMRSRPVP